MLDVLFREGTVVDGSGRTAFPADVGIVGSMIAAVGDLSSASAEHVVNAAGLVVCPGFVDVHTHSDLTLLINGRAESKVRQGVTTEIIGNCSCGKGIKATQKEFTCDCGKIIPKTISGKKLTPKQAVELMNGKKILLKGLKNEQKEKFNSLVSLNAESKKLFFENP